MEMQESNSPKNDLIYQKTQNDGSNNGWHILSLLSWMLFICTIWNSYINREFNLSAKFLEYFISAGVREYNYIWVRGESAWLILFIFLISLLGFATYLIFTTFMKNQNLYDGMLGNWSKFHFIPLFFISALFILSNNVLRSYYSISEEEIKNDLNYNKMLLIFNIIFTLIALISLIFVYIKTELQCEWYLVLTIKKGVFSTFIILLWYNFFCVIVLLRTYDFYLKNIEITEGESTDEKPKIESLWSFYKGMYIAFSIVIGIVSLAFAFFFKDIIAAFVNFLIYLGFVMYFFTTNRTEAYKKFRDEYFGGNAVGIIDIIMMLLTLVFIVFMALRYSQYLV